VSIGTQLPRSPLGTRLAAAARVDSGVSRDPSYGSPNGPKSVGAYYTPTPVARALSDWALRRPGERALDPAAGDGVFLAEAARRARELGGCAGDVRGVEMRPEAAGEAARRLRAIGAEAATVHVADFLGMEPAAGPAFDAVLGNPPFVRFQRMERARRERASAVAARAGVRLDSMASSWAAFVLHAGAFLRPGGRLALVVPSEIGHARYARPVLEHLRARFGTVTFVLFESALFPSLDQGTVLLLADGRGEPFRGFSAARLTSVDALAAGLERTPRFRLDADALVRGSAKLHHAWLPSAARGLLDGFATEVDGRRLGAWASVSIGYVTGHNDFFHLSPARAASLGLAPEHLLRSLFRSRALRGLRVTDDDWRRGAERGLSGYLLAPRSADDGAVAAYLATGAERAVQERAKVRHRRPWYRVTRTEPPDLVLTAMSGGAPRLAVNSAGAAVCNTLHAVRLRPGLPPGSADLLALAALTSLSELSAELEGHALGGGLLKIEPSEALRWVLPLPRRDAGGERPTFGPGLRAVAHAADRALRAGEPAEARRLADRALWIGACGMTEAGADALASAAERLRSLRRGARGSPSAPEPRASPTPGGGPGREASP